MDALPASAPVTNLVAADFDFHSSIAVMNRHI
jgi:hypothetical protein